MVIKQNGYNPLQELIAEIKDHWPAEKKMKVHFIAIGGSAMHNLALALYQKGYQVTGSDDEINEPSRSRLANAGILHASNR